MLTNTSMVSSSTTDNRMFVYEIKGLHQNDRTSQAASPIRSSDAVFMSVPFDRMSSFMQRMNRLGGTIVAIHSSWDAATQSVEESNDASEAAE